MNADAALCITVAYTADEQAQKIDTNALYLAVLAAVREQGIEPVHYEAGIEPFDSARHVHDLDFTEDRIGIWKAPS